MEFKDSKILWLDLRGVNKLLAYVERALAIGLDKRILRVQLLEGSERTYLVEYVG